MGREGVLVAMPWETMDLRHTKSAQDMFLPSLFLYVSFQISTLSSSSTTMYLCMHKAQLVLFWETSPQSLRRFDHFCETVSREVRSEQEECYCQVLCLSCASRVQNRGNHSAPSPERTPHSLAQRFRGKVFTCAHPQTLNMTFVPLPHFPSVHTS